MDLSSRDRSLIIFGVTAGVVGTLLIVMMFIALKAILSSQ